MSAFPGRVKFKTEAFLCTGNLPGFKIPPCNLGLVFVPWPVVLEEKYRGARE